MTSLESYRQEFPILQETTYLISNSLGAMPQKAVGSLQNYAKDWNEKGVRAWQDWWHLPTQVGDKIAHLIGAEKDSVNLQLNVTSAQAVVASCFDFSGHRNKVVYSDMNFPSVSYFYLAQQELGAVVEIVKSDDGISVDLEKLLDAIDDKTLLVPISHVLFRSSFIQNAKAIAEKCKKVGAYLVLDVYQSVGVVPIHVKEWGVDFAIGGTLKWLCGGPGVAFMYVNPKISSKLNPKFTGWLSDINPFGFDVYEHRLAEGARRFMNGTPNIPGMYACIPGLKIISEIGIDTIRGNSIRQTTMMVEKGIELGWKITTPMNPSERGGTVAFDLEHGYEISQELIARNILVDYRPKAGIRVSPHFYTTDDEIQHFFHQTQDIIETGAYKKHLGTKTVVT